MYLIAWEDGEMFEATTINNDDKNACDSGILSIIDVKTMKSYYEGEWHNLRIWGDNK